MGFKDENLGGKRVQVRIWVKFVDSCPQMDDKLSRVPVFGIGIYGGWNASSMAYCRPDEWMIFEAERIAPVEGHTDWHQIIFILDDLKTQGQQLQIAQMIVHIDGQGVYERLGMFQLSSKGLRLCGQVLGSKLIPSRI